MYDLPPTEPASSYPTAYHSTPLCAPPPPRKRHGRRILFAVLGLILLISLTITALLILRSVQQARIPGATPGTNTPIPLYGAPPQLGGPISDFIGKYGSPHQNDSSSTGFDFWADSNQTILLTVTPDGNLAHMVKVSAPSTWYADQTKAYCEQFLPTDAAQYTTNGASIFYHSNVGNVQMQFGAGSCLLTFV